ncbi:glycosyltransferase [Patescibacteria group bacterium]
MILRYITSLKYPSKYANRMQVIKMSEAFSERVDFKLFCASFLDDKENVFNSYGVTSKPFIEELGSVTKLLWPRSFWFAFRCKKAIEKEVPSARFYIRDVLLAYFLLLISKRFKKNFFFEIHSLGKFPKFIYKKVFFNAKSIISTNNNKTDELIKEFGLQDDKVITAFNGVDLRVFENLPSKTDIRKKLSLPVDKIIIMYVGSTQFWKGTDIIPECAKALPHCLFVVVGGDMQSKDNIVNFPRVPWREVPLYFHAADILIAPYSFKYNISKLWTSPIKILEYMASGIPIVASDLPSVRELLDNDSAYLADAGDVGVFCKGIQWVINNKEEMAKRAEKAREKIKNFSWQSRADRILNFIQKD